MSGLSIGGKPVGVLKNQDLSETVIVKLSPDLVDKAKESAKTDGADNIFFTAGKETYVASGKGLNMSKTQVDNVFYFHDEKETVIASLGGMIGFSSGGMTAGEVGSTIGKFGIKATAVIAALSLSLVTLWRIQNKRC